MTQVKIMKFILFVVIIITFALSGCDSDKSGFTSKKTKTKDCILPQNPYNDGGGHDAGFNWAMENGRDCDGNSDSFNEGCLEYYRQLNEYKACVSKRK